MYYRLRQEAFDAQFSDDRKVAANGRRLLRALERIEKSDRLVTLEVRSMGEGQSHGTGPRTGGEEGFGVVINRDYRPDINRSAALAHELGHAWSYMAYYGWFTDAVAIATENYVRDIRHCLHRTGNEPIGWEPPCG